VQASLGLPGQDIFLVPLLPGTDGRKMSKSFGNTIDLTDPPGEMYGKAMSISDAMLDAYLTLVSRIPDGKLEEIRRGISSGATNPRDIKMLLARDIVEQFYGNQQARQAEEEFVRVFQQRELPSDVPEYALSAPTPIIDVLVGAGLASSSSEARRLITQGGVRINDNKVDDLSELVQPEEETIIRAGRRKFIKIVRQS